MKTNASNAMHAAPSAKPQEDPKAPIATIDLVNLRNYTRETGQPTHPEMLDTAPMEHVKEIEITEEHITIKYNERISRTYNTNEITHKEWEYKYNDDAEMVRAVARVIDLARRHLKDLPENVACPPGCAECCSGYEPFVSRADVQRIADHFGMAFNDVLTQHVVQRKSADGHYLGYLKKITPEIESQCVFLKGTKSGRYYCGIYSARPSDCREFTPIGCEDVDASLPRAGSFPVGPPFVPRHPRGMRNGRLR
ncbi:MAG: hypothetical protein DLM50_04205 [Candidatus Meridianibacter frigidus]|nr:MAG: hypothetical protein DLM50_04205 [Candidatus Eremiobacteraeota bacterium]